MKKKLIRSNVYETNSSSSHSVSIADETKEFVLDTIYPDQNGVVTLTGGEYGWEWFKTNDAMEKANYAVQSLGLTDTLKEVIMEQTGATDVVFKDNDGYVDHDSYGVSPSDPYELKQFIFNKNSWLFGGNDNTRPRSDFYDVPEYKDGRIYNPEYKYKLTIEGYSEESKFLEKPSEDDISTALSALLGDVSMHESGYLDNDNSVYAQLARDSRKIYRFSDYEKPIDFEKNICFFIKDAWSEARTIYESDPTNKGKEWNEGYHIVKKIEKELLNEENSRFVKPVKFYVTAI